MSLTVLFQDDWLVAVDKPAGMPVHRSRQCPEREVALRAVRDQTGRHVYPVHRLDRATSGVLVFGFSREAAAGLCEQWRKREVAKEYLAVVRGWLADDVGVVDYPLAEEEGSAPQAAVTRYRCLRRAEMPWPTPPHPTSRYSLVLVTTETGRRHQIRRHFHHLSHPVVGDTVYGDGRHNRRFRDTFACHRLLLHAARVAFCHPVTGEELTLASGPDESFLSVLAGLGWGQERLAEVGNARILSPIPESPLSLAGVRNG